MSSAEENELEARAGYVRSYVLVRTDGRTELTTRPSKGLRGALGLIGMGELIGRPHLRSYLRQVTEDERKSPDRSRRAPPTHSSILRICILDHQA